MDKQEFVVRRAIKTDMDCVRTMIQELADFENMSDGPTLSIEDLIRDAGLKDNTHEFCHCYVVETKDVSQDLNLPLTIVGYAICYFAYSTWQGKSYFLEDIYVRPLYRNLGVGRIIIEKLQQCCKEFGCKRLDFHVLGWNPARNFYAKIGAVDLTELEDWHYYRLNIN